ncbi:MAG: MerR family transcriptional regulator [Duodenibacillus sp.]|nr:MerR family transcriptional regulator [Duodenibacillus sp.]
MQQYSIEELSRLTGVTRRNIRYYIQRGLLARPEGERRSAYYTEAHLEALLRIVRLTAEHVPLDEIPAHGGGDAAARPGRGPGAVRVCSHIELGAGVELVVDQQAAELDARQMREMTRAARELVIRLKALRNNPTEEEN